MKRIGSTAKIGLMVACGVVLSSLAAAQTTIWVPVQRRIVVSIPDRQLAVIENGRVLARFYVSVGADVSPSPTGEFRIINRVANPTYYHQGVVIPAGADNPVGPRWIGLNQKGYGIHGTNEPHSIGKAASHGCIRLRNHDVVELFTLVRVGDAVQISSERDEEIGRIFPDGASRQAIVAENAAAVSGSAGGQ